VGSCTGVIHNRKNSRGFFLFDEVANDFIIKEIDWGPFDLFPNVFFLLLLERQLNKNLLEFLVHIVDAELLKAIVLLIILDG